MFNKRSTLQLVLRAITLESVIRRNARNRYPIRGIGTYGTYGSTGSVDFSWTGVP